MAQRIERFATVAAAGAADQYVNHTFLDGVVRRVELYVPSGHAGLTEWSFWYGDSQLLPRTTGGRIIANDRRFEWDLDDVPTGDNYRSLISNADVFAHRFHVEVWLDEFDSPLASPSLPILVLPFTDA